MFVSQPFRGYYHSVIEHEKKSQDFAFAPLPRDSKVLSYETYIPYLNTSEPLLLIHSPNRQERDVAEAAHILFRMKTNRDP